MTRQIVFIDESTAIGGAEVLLLMEGPALRECGWEPLIIVPRAGPLVARLEELGLPVKRIPVPPLRSASLYIAHRYKLPNFFALTLNTILGAVWVAHLIHFLKLHRPMVVQTVSMWSHVFGGMAARLAGLPIIWHVQDIVSPDSGFGFYRWLFLQAARIIPSRIICISNCVAAQFDSTPSAHHKLYLLPNSIDISRFTLASARNTSPILTIGTVARLTPWKGHEVAIEAARQLHERGLPFHWLIAGDETLGWRGYREHLLNLIHCYGLEAHVDLVGWVSDMAAFYRTLDVLVHVPTEPEPFGLVLAEAMASGLPIVTTNGGLENLIPMGGGFIVPSACPEAVTDKLIELWQNPVERLARGRAARQVAEENFVLTSYIERLISLYKSV